MTQFIALLIFKATIMVLATYLLVHGFISAEIWAGIAKWAIS